MTEKWRVAPELLRSVPAVVCPLWVSFKRKLIVLARAPASSFTAVSVYTSDVGVIEPNGIRLPGAGAGVS